MADSTFLDRAPQMNAEHEAWIEALARLAGALDLGEVGAFNDSKFDPAIDAIRVWGERLVALRILQTEEERAKALHYAVGLAENGR